MKDADAKGYAPLYVRSFRSWKGEEGAMVDVFSHARLMAPCVLVLEDLDSLINPGNRSFFLNQLDGLDSNDGLLIIGTTNHLENMSTSETPNKKIGYGMLLVVPLLLRIADVHVLFSAPGQIGLEGVQSHPRYDAVRL